MNCVVCGKEFTPVQNNSVCCSVDCKKIRSAEQQKQWRVNNFHTQKKKCTLAGEDRENAIKLLIMLKRIAEEYPNKKPNIDLALLRPAFDDIRRKKLLIMR